MTAFRMPRYSRRTYRLTFLALLLVLVGGLVLVPSQTAHADECDDLPGPSIQETCREEGWFTEEYGKDKKHPSIDDPMGLKPDCKSAPVPAAPGHGDGSWALTPPRKAPTPIPPSDTAWSSHLYEQYGLAGMEWATYDLKCESPSDLFHAMNADFGSTWGSRIFGWSRWWTSMATSLQEQAVQQGYISRLYVLSAETTRGVADSVYRPWIVFSVLVLGLGIIFRARKQDWAGTVQSVGWAAAVMAVTTVVFQNPTAVGKMADDVIVSTVGQVQQGVAGDLSHGSKAGVAQGNHLAKGILFEGWLRGELGSSDSKVAKKYGPILYDAQTLNWSEARLPSSERLKVIDDKRKTWEKTASKIKDEDPEAYRYLTGQGGGRVTVGLETGLGATPANLYTFASSALIACARLIIPTGIMFLPAIAPLAIHRRLTGTLRSLMDSTGAALINAPIFAAASGIEVLAVKALFNDDIVPEWFAVVLLWLVTIMIWVMTRPLRRLNAMVSPNSSWFGSGVGFMSAARRTAGSAALGYVTGRMRARQIGRVLNGGQDKSAEDPQDASAGAGDAVEHTSARHTGRGRRRNVRGRGPDFNELAGAQERIGGLDPHRRNHVNDGYLYGDGNWLPEHGQQGAADTGPLYTPPPSAEVAVPDASVSSSGEPVNSISAPPPVIAEEPPVATPGAYLQTVASIEAGRRAAATPSSVTPAQDRVEGDRPAPFIAPQIDDDGQRVFVVYSPSSGFGQHSGDEGGF